MDERANVGIVRQRSANDRFKDLWDARVAWSSVSAVAFHAVLLGWAGWTVVQPVFESAPARGQLILLPASVDDGAGFEGRSTPLALPEEAAPEVVSPANGGLEGEELGGTGDSEVLDLWSAAAARLGYEGRFRADVVDMEAEVAAAAQPAAESDSATPTGMDSMVTLAELEHADSLDMELDFDRLTELRPELAVMIPSLWILLRNPTEVEAFLRRSYGRWTLDRNRPGSVTVTVWVDTRGSVEWAEVSASSGQPNLDEAALALFNDVVAFRPARHEGVSVSGSATFALLFPW